MKEPQLILGFFMLLGGLLLIALNHTGAQSYEEDQKALGRWGKAQHAYLTWQIISTIFGSFMALLGALVLYRSAFSN